MTTRRSIFLLCLLLASFVNEECIPLRAQSTQDSIDTLPVVNITSTKTRHATAGSTSQIWETSQLEKIPTHTVADVLQTETGAFIKSYGQGSLATSSVRGGSAGHTLVLWNGLPIQSPMLGQLDLALLPLQVAESVSFTKGGNTTMWGSGAIGGMVSLANTTDFSNRLKISSGTHVGSFGLFHQQVNVSLGTNRIQSATKFYYRKANNDYNYFVADGLPQRKQQNAKLEQQFFGQDIHWRLNDRHQLSGHVWWQQSDRQIPPTNVQNRSQAHQDDFTTRLLVNYHHTRESSKWNAKIGYFDERLNYYDDLILLTSRSHFRTLIGELTGQWFWKRQVFMLGNVHTHTRAWSPGYRETIPSEYKTALFASWQFNTDKWKSQVSLRQEMVDGELVPLVPSIGFDWQVKPALIIRGKVSRNYRLPTFNDRYWMPGGNPALLPESGWSQECILAHDKQHNKTKYTLSLTAFNRSIDNWILWSLVDGQSFWSANNITKVWSRGLEPRMSIRRNTGVFSYEIKMGYDYIRSTNQVALENPKINAGDQLIYTPMHQAIGSLSVEWRSLHFSYQHTYTGASDGINEPLSAYHVGNLRLQVRQTKNKLKGTIFFNINNLWDAQYLVVERRPMPGIHFQTGFNITFSKKHKT